MKTKNSIRIAVANHATSKLRPSNVKKETMMNGTINTEKQT